MLFLWKQKPEEMATRKWRENYARARVYGENLVFYSFINIENTNVLVQVVKKTNNVVILLNSN